MEKVSAIITTHNRADLLKRSIESVLNRTYKNLECIVVDDNSTDNTREVCNQFPVNYIYIPKEETRGGNYARNLGIKAASGDYCAFLDDDDYWLPEKIEKQVKMAEEKDCELVYCGMRLEIIKKEGIIYEDKLPSPSASGDMSKLILQFIATTTSCILCKKQALIEVGLFDEELKFWQEYELTIRLAQRSPFYFVNAPLIVYRLNQQDSNRLTNKYFEWLTAVDYIHHKHEALYSQLSLQGKARAKYLKWADAAQRCDSAGLLCRKVYYKLLMTPFELIARTRKIVRNDTK